MSSTVHAHHATQTTASSSSLLTPPASQLRPRASSVSNGLSLNGLSPRIRSNSNLPPEPQTPSALVRKDTAPTTTIGSLTPATSGLGLSLAGSGSAPTTTTTTNGTGTSMSDQHPGTLDRSMLSVLLSLGAAATSSIPLPPLVRSQSQPPPSSSASSTNHSSLLSPHVNGGVSNGYTYKPHKPIPRQAQSQQRSWGTQFQTTHHVSPGVYTNVRSNSDEDSTPPQSPFTSLFVSPPSPISLLPTPPFQHSHHRRYWSLHKRHPRSLYAPLFFLLLTFVLTTTPVLISLWSLPIPSLKHIPKTLGDISTLLNEIRTYAGNGNGNIGGGGGGGGRMHVLLVLSLTTMWKHAWSIPGSVLLNVMAGGLMGKGSGWVWMMTIYMTFLTSCGTVFATLLSRPLGGIVNVLFPKAVALTRGALEGDISSRSGGEEGFEEGVWDEKLGRMVVVRRQGVVVPMSGKRMNEGMMEGSRKKTTPTWVRLVVMRVVGVVPWSGINVACGVVGVSLWDCFVGSFIGTLPWTAVTCQIGDIIQTLSATSFAASAASTTNASSTSGTFLPYDASAATPQTLSSVLASPAVVTKLVFLSALSLGPVLFRGRLKALVSSSGEEESGDGKMETEMVFGGRKGSEYESDEQTVVGSDDSHSRRPFFGHHKHKRTGSKWAFWRKIVADRGNASEWESGGKGGRCGDSGESSRRGSMDEDVDVESFSEGSFEGGR
ncbi:uncharacterized protein EI90DRAFT_3017628 [Cantharellus anzutake]|uniref:uncharacterized protein n=1 Tax=Cantharellus anzutake TaxID=1750568 RepID=UPI0019041099|nr:uncharacterized protein EI90DRAFT_3017628 [Cantharellus anzutake]KAF8328578.1 hypothetical protein EI90DRAFT_3017628 [Cantharellus anzutake]